MLTKSYTYTPVTVDQIIMSSVLHKHNIIIQGMMRGKVLGGTGLSPHQSFQWILYHSNIKGKSIRITRQKVQIYLKVDKIIRKFVRKGHISIQCTEIWPFLTNFLIVYF